MCACILDGDTANAGDVPSRRRHGFGADLIIVDWQGERGLRRSLLGSVSREVIRYAAHPVLIVQHEDGHVTDLHTQTLFA